MKYFAVTVSVFNWKQEVIFLWAVPMIQFRDCVSKLIVKQKVMWEKSSKSSLRRLPNGKVVKKMQMMKIE